MKIQVLGLGSPILTDDGVGVHIVQELMKETLPLSVTLTIGGTGGAALLDMIEDCDRLIIVDAIQTGAPPGTIHELSLNDIKTIQPIHFGFLHGIDFFTSIQLKKKFHQKVPPEIIVIAVEAMDIHSFSEECTPPVKNSMNQIVSLINTKCSAPFFLEKNN